MEAWTVERVENYCRYLSSLVGDEFDCPVKINGRLTRTLGRVCYIQSDFGVKYTELEMSKQFLETSTDEYIIDTIKHEFCHYLAIKQTGISHGHDDYFKSLCKQIGCSADGVATTVERRVGVKDKDIYKYGIFCPECDKMLRGYHRKTKAVKYPELYRCNVCGCDHLYSKEL